MTMEEINCLFCNISNTNIVITENGYSGRKCPDCNLIYISPRPSPVDIINLYKDNAAHITANAHISENYLTRLHARHNLKIINRFKNNGTLLEIGPGGGKFLIEAAKQGFECYGAEFNPLQADYINNNLGIPCENSLDVFSANKIYFDIIYHCDVLSHFYDPISEFNKINSLLKPGGFVVFETGNLGDVREKYYKYIDKFQYPDHLFFFSEKNIVELLKRTNFILMKMYNYSILPELFIMKLKTSLRKKHNNPKINDSSSSSQEKNSIKRKLKDYVKYFLTYKLGYIAFKKGRPQTIVTVAGKK